MPTRMLPKEIEKTLDKLGKDGDKVRGRWSVISLTT